MLWQGLLRVYNRIHIRHDATKADTTEYNTAARFAVDALKRIEFTNIDYTMENQIYILPDFVLVVTIFYLLIRKQHRKS